MSRRTYELNQRLARIEARLDAIAPDPEGPPRAVFLDAFGPERQAEFIREGRVSRGKVY